MDFERIIVKSNKYTTDTVTRLDFKRWVGLHSTYTAPVDIRLMPSFRRDRKPEYIELMNLIDKMN